MSRALFVLKEAIEEATEAVRDESGIYIPEEYTVIAKKRGNAVNYYKRLGRGKNRHEYALPENEIDKAISTSIRRMQINSDIAFCNKRTAKMLIETAKEIRKKLEKENDYIVSKYRGIPRPSQNPGYGMTLHHKSARGELMRSKSEVIIANALHSFKIDYCYEWEVKTFYPDFIIPVSIQGRPIYWEHCGMMDDENYARHWYYKKTEYEKRGITENDNLIVTFDGPKGVIDSQQIDRIIKKWFLP